MKTKTPPGKKKKSLAGRPPSGRTYRISTFRVLPEVGEQMAAAAAREGWAPLIERLWHESRGGSRKPASE